MSLVYGSYVSLPMGGISYRAVSLAGGTSADINAPGRDYLASDTTSQFAQVGLVFSLGFNNDLKDAQHPKG